MDFIETFKVFFDFDIYIDIRYTEEYTFIHCFYLRDDYEITKYLEFVFLGLKGNKEKDFGFVHYSIIPDEEITIGSIILNKESYLKQRLNIWKYLVYDLMSCSVLVSAKQFDEALERRRGLE